MRLREEVTILKQKISSLSIEVTSYNTEWEQLHSTYLILLEDLKRQVEKNDVLNRTLLELETVIERYNTSVSGSETFIKQQLEILAKSTLKNQSINYVSHKREIMETQNELQSMRMKIGRIESSRFNKSAVTQNFTFNSFQQTNSHQSTSYLQQTARSILERSLNTPLEINKSVVVPISVTPEENVIRTPMKVINLN